jgi:long-chain fatty acid transport protein
MNKHPLSLRKAILSSAILLTMNSQSFASGFAIIEQGVSGLGNAYAGGAASALDATTIFFNPAGLTSIENRQFIVAGHVIATQANFSNNNSTDLLGNTVALGNSGGNAGGESLVPNVYYSMPVNEDITFGIGINAPFGLKTEYDSGWIGRYHALKSDLKTVNINPSIGWKASDRLSLGFGVNAQYIKATLTRALDTGSACIGTLIANGTPAATAVTTCSTTFGLSPQQNDGLAEIKGDDWSFGYNLGALYQVADTTRVGFAYRSKIKQELEGSADFTIPTGFSNFLTFVGSSSFVDTGAQAQVDLPETYSLSIYHDVNDKVSVMADATYTRWNRFKELRVTYDSGQADSVTPEQWENVWRFSVGSSYRIENNLILRAGVAFDQEPIASDSLRTARIPGNDRTWFTVGAQFATSENMNLDIGYAHLRIADTGINNTDSTAGTLTGSYNNGVDIFSAQLTYNFD